MSHTSIRFRLRRALVVGAAALIAPLPVLAGFDAAAACKAADGWQRIVQEAGQEGEVLMSSNRGEADNARLLDGFMKKYPGIKASAIRLVGNRMNERIEQELKAGVLAADVTVFSDATFMAGKQKAGLLVPPCGPSVALWDKAGSLYPIKELVPIGNEPWVLAYNTSLVKNKPKDWNDLAGDQSFAGRVGLNEVSGLTVAVWADYVASRAGADYFDRLAPLKPRLYPNSAPLVQGIVAGEIAWSPYSLPSSIEPLKAKGAPIDWIVPASGTFMLQRFAMVLKAAPHPAAAMLLLDYMMSAEGQTLINGNRQGLTVAPGIRIATELKVDLKKTAVIDTTKYGDATAKKWMAKFNQLYR
jgi:iron(III) transport system substrate-binding protein